MGSDSQGKHTLGTSVPTGSRQPQMCGVGRRTHLLAREAVDGAVGSLDEGEVGELARVAHERDREAERSVGGHVPDDLAADRPVLIVAQTTCRERRDARELRRAGVAVAVVISIGARR